MTQSLMSGEHSKECMACYETGMATQTIGGTAAIAHSLSPCPFCAERENDTRRGFRTLYGDEINGMDVMTMPIEDLRSIQRYARRYRHSAIREAIAAAAEEFRAKNKGKDCQDENHHNTVQRIAMHCYLTDDDSILAKTKLEPIGN